MTSVYKKKKKEALTRLVFLGLDICKYLPVNKENLSKSSIYFSAMNIHLFNIAIFP